MREDSDRAAELLPAAFAVEGDPRAETRGRLSYLSEYLRPIFSSGTAVTWRRFLKANANSMSLRLQVSTKFSARSISLKLWALAGSVVHMSGPSKKRPVAVFRKSVLMF